jgi:hypothetical protein
MPELRIAMTLLAVLLGCCITLSIGAYFGRKSEVSKVYMVAGVIAVAGLIFFVIYAAWYLLTKQG